MNVNNEKWRELLNKLEKYKAPEDLIVDKDINAQDQEWTTLLNKLPSEVAPSSLPNIGNEDRVSTKILSNRNWLSIAASLLILFSFWFFWPSNNADVSIVLTQQDELPNQLNNEIIWSLDEFCEAYHIQCDHYEINQLRDEWEDISLAKMNILESLENNQNDEFLLRQLSILEARHAEMVNELLKIVLS